MNRSVIGKSYNWIRECISESQRENERYFKPDSTIEIDESHNYRDSEKKYTGIRTLPRKKSIVITYGFASYKRLERYG